MRVTRRDFMKYCAISAGALGMTASDLGKIEKALSTEYADGGTHVVWLNGAACTGCTVSLANTINANSIQGLLAPLNTVEAALLGGAVDIGPNGPLDLDFMETLNTAVGARAVNSAFNVLTSGEPFALCLEGAIQTAEDGRYCQIWRVQKEHTLINLAWLEESSFVWASADREELKVPNDTSEPIKVVTGEGGDAITLIAPLFTVGSIEMHAGSIIAAGSILNGFSWVEKSVDRAALAADAAAYTFDADNKVVGAAGPTGANITLTGRIFLKSMSTLAAGSRISSCSLVYVSSDRVAMGGVYAIAPRVTADRTVLKDYTHVGTIRMAWGSVLMPGTVIKIGSWVETAADRAAIGGAYDADKKVAFGDITLATAVTLSGTVELLPGGFLKAMDVQSATYLADTNDEDRSFADEVLNFAISDSCAVVIAVGTCASYGGIPAANGSVTGARGLIGTSKICYSESCGESVEVQGYWDWLLENCKITREQWEDLMCKTVCVPGCPPHPDWIVGTISYFLKVGTTPTMDKFHRPISYYGEYQCKNCIWTWNYASNVDIDGQVNTSKSNRIIGNSPKLYYYKYNSSYEGCLGILGCKGRKTKADCSFRRWNGDGPGGQPGQLTADVINGTVVKGGVSWCVQTRGGCHGCTEPRFPDGWGPFFMYK